jgi:serine/threonine protein kinase
MSDMSTDLSQLSIGALHETQVGRAIAAKEPFQGRYSILKVLGRGSFGITFQARDITLPGEVLCVVKILSPKTSSSHSLPLIRERFEQEARVLGKLGGHAQIPLLLNYFELEGERYLVQEYFEGVTLADRVKRKGVFTEVKTKQFLDQALPLLHYIHDNQVVHRDIKPENLIQCQSPDRRLILIDFGSAKEFTAPGTGLDTQAFAVTQSVGTLGFAPPEQLQKRPVYASDLYALGMTCLYLLTAKYPWELDWKPNRTLAELKQTVNVSEPFLRFFCKLTALSVPERYASASAAISALQALDFGGATLANASPRSQKDDNSVDSPPPAQGNYLSPIIRLATDIRGWRSRSQSVPPPDSSETSPHPPSQPKP